MCYVVFNAQTSANIVHLTTEDDAIAYCNSIWTVGMTVDYERCADVDCAVREADKSYRVLEYSSLNY